MFTNVHPKVNIKLITKLVNFIVERGQCRGGGRIVDLDLAIDFTRRAPLPDQRQADIRLDAVLIQGSFQIFENGAQLRVERSQVADPPPRKIEVRLRQPHFIRLSAQHGVFEVVNEVRVPDRPLDIGTRLQLRDDRDTLVIDFGQVFEGMTGLGGEVDTRGHQQDAEKQHPAQRQFQDIAVPHRITAASRTIVSHK